MGESTVEVLAWVGIAVCILHSAMFSGLNLAMFGVSRLRLEVENSRGNPGAATVLELRKDSNFLLTTILWGNVGVNVLLTLLSESVMAGVIAFLFSTVVITFLGEIIPQAYFSRHALRTAALLSPVIRFYQKVLYPVARPSAKVLDWWLGYEGVQYYRERDLRLVIKKHLEAAETDIDRLEGIGALNFLTLDDLTVAQVGSTVRPDSILELPAHLDLPVFPQIRRSREDPFLQRVQASGLPWVVLTDPQGYPRLILDADAFLREAMFGEGELLPYEFCHRPVVIDDPTTLLGNAVSRLELPSDDAEGDVIDKDVILVWGDQKRVITGADLLGRLLRGIVIPRGRPTRSTVVKSSAGQGAEMSTNRDAGVAVEDQDPSL